jgi:hypothetical protein
MHNGYDPATANVQYLLLPTINPTLYRKFSQTLRVDTWRAPQYNIDDWLDPSSPHFKPEMQDAIFHYSARSEAGEQFEVCISTSEMDNAAWKYGHHSQIILDRTFGVCSTRLLLFITMAVDEHGKGVPIVLFLFSAPTGNRATQAGYNTAILWKLLTQWKTHLKVSHGSDDKFTPYVAIMDTDTKERSALLDVWINICLLICKFHLQQCWTNHQKKLLGGKPGSKPDFWKDHIRDQLCGFEVK